MVIDPTTLIPVALYGLLYAQLVVHRRRASGRIDWPRTCAYTLGLVEIVVALDSKLDALADEGSMAAHMVQHELLGNLAPVLHALGHAMFIATGLLFWFHVLRPLPALVTLTPRQKLTYLLTGTLGGAVVAAVLVGAPHALYGTSMQSQQLAGAVMMGVEMPLAIGAALWVFLRAVTRRPLGLAVDSP
jgi:cytochrome c oxidase assembly factor CtaG